MAGSVLSCKKLVQVDPPINEIIGKEIYNSDANAASVITGIYTDMSGNGIFTGTNSISLKLGLAADELVSATEPNNILNIIYTNSLTNQGIDLFWPELYAYIFKANSVIEGVGGSDLLSANVKKQLMAEAKFIRAFMYFYLVNLYGDVPLLLSTDINDNSNASRTATAIVYEQIVADLLDARDDINEDYLQANAITTTSERVKPNKAVVTALLSRVYLYTQQWELAETEASALINNNSYQIEDIDNKFLLSGRESIWQLQPINAGRNTMDAEAFVLLTGAGYSVGGPNGGDRPVYLANALYNSFENNDKRKEKWIGTVTIEPEGGGSIVYHFPYKYKAWEQDQPRTEYLTVMRLSEQYLIRAEARAHIGKLTGANSAVDDINLLRQKAGVDNTTAASMDEIANAIINERRAELFTEWGHRWFDLKRTGKIDEVMPLVAPLKGGEWNTYKSLFPIPVQDIQRSAGLRGHQNPGYAEI
jgi:hypothetical protein